MPGFGPSVEAAHSPTAVRAGWVPVRRLGHQPPDVTIDGRARKFIRRNVHVSWLKECLVGSVAAYSSAVRDDHMLVGLARGGPEVVLRRRLPLLKFLLPIGELLGQILLLLAREDVNRPLFRHRRRELLRESLAFCFQLGLLCVQGVLVCRPLPLDDVPQFLLSRVGG